MSEMQDLSLLTIEQLEALMHNPIFDHDPEWTLFGRVHTPEQLAYLQQWGGCPTCDNKPESWEPLSAGWVWDCQAFTTWAWCPECLEKFSSDESDDE